MQILAYIGEIVQDHSDGLDVRELHKLLSQELGVDHFDPQIFGCEYFHLFLLNFAESYVDIEIAKSIAMGGISFNIYPKNFKFGKTQKSKNCKKEKEKVHSQSQKKLSTSLKLNSEPFKFRATESPNIDNKNSQKSSNFGRVDSKPELGSQKASKKVIANWASVINTSFLDELPSYNSQVGNLSHIKNSEDDDIHTPNTPSNNNQKQLNFSIKNNDQSFVELKEYLDYINIMVPEKANEELRRTFYSMNNENSIDNKSHNITF